MIDWSKAYSPAEIEKARLADKAKRVREAAEKRRFDEFVESMIDADNEKLKRGQPL